MATLSRAWRWITSVYLPIEWPVVAAACLAIFLLGAYGFDQVCGNRPMVTCGGARAWLDDGYLSLQLFVWQSGAPEIGRWPHPTALEFARFLAPLALGWIALRALMLLFADRVAAVRARFRRGHVIVCGLGRHGLALARSLREAGWAVVMLELDDQQHSGTARAFGAVLAGDATDPSALRRAGVRRASHLVAVCGDDAVNAEVIARASAEATDQRHVLTCHAHVGHPALWERLRPRELASSRAGTSRHQFFNTIDVAARAVVAESLPSAGVEAPHLALVGGGPVAERTLIHAALAWRFVTPPVRLRITLVQRGGPARIAALHAAYPRLADVCDVVARELDAEAPDHVQRTVAALQGGPPVSAVCVFGTDDARQLALGLGLLHATAHESFPVVVSAQREQGLSLLVGDGAADVDRRLTVIGTLERGCTAESLLGGSNEVLARAIHAEYVRTQAASGHTTASNPSMVPWIQLPESLRTSNRRQADDLSEKLASERCFVVPYAEWDTPVFEFETKEVERLARREHARWLDERRAWTPAQTKDLHNTESPHLRAWEKLEEEVKEIDRNTVRRIPAFLARVGLGIERRAAAAPATASQTSP